MSMGVVSRVAAWLVFLVVVCFSSELQAVTFTAADGPVEVNSWGYRLTGSPAEGDELLVAPLAAAPHDALVIDYSHFGDEPSAFTAAEINSIKHSDPALGGDGHRKLLAGYMSIGQARDFRSYWVSTPGAWTQNGHADSPLTSSAPSWLGPVDQDWPEGRYTRYWQSGWQNIIYNNAKTGYLDKIVSQGFDAAYLDIVEAYYFWAAQVDPADRQPGDPTTEKEAAQRMIDFVVNMTAHARETNPNFFVIPQNGAAIIDALEDEDPTRKAAYLDAIGAIGVEDVYLPGDADENNPMNPDAYRIGLLKQDYLANGKAVFAVDYANDPTLVDQFTAAAQADGFMPYAAPSRELDVLGPPTTVPEPATLSLLLPGLLLWRRRMAARE